MGFQYPGDGTKLKDAAKVELTTRDKTKCIICGQLLIDGKCHNTKYCTLCHKEHCSKMVHTTM